MSVPYCPRCGTPIMPGARQCLNCGLSFAVPTPTDVRPFRARSKWTVDLEGIVGFLSITGGVLLVLAVPLTLLIIVFLLTDPGESKLSVFAAALFSTPGFFVPPICGWAGQGVLGWFMISIGRDARAGQLEGGFGLLLGAIFALGASFILLGGPMALVAGVLLLVAAILAFVAMYS